MPAHGLILSCLPSSDRAFRRVAEAMLDAPRMASPPSDEDRAAFEARLRTVYPEAAVHARDALAALTSGEVWYVYREERHADPDPWRVLIVEDNRDLARMMEAAIRAEGAEVRSAPDGEAALTLADDWRPDLIVLDLGLPKLDGRGFAAAYRENGGDVPIVVVSGAPDAAATSRQIGAHGWLPKPFELDALIELVRRGRGFGMQFA